MGWFLSPNRISHKVRHLVSQLSSIARLEDKGGYAPHGTEQSVAVYPAPRYPALDGVQRKDVSGIRVRVFAKSSLHHQLP